MARVTQCKSSSHQRASCTPHAAGSMHTTPSIAHWGHGPSIASRSMRQWILSWSCASGSLNLGYNISCLRTRRISHVLAVGTLSRLAPPLWAFRRTDFVRRSLQWIVADRGQRKHREVVDQHALMVDGIRYHSITAIPHPAVKPCPSTILATANIPRWLSIDSSRRPARRSE